MRIYTLASISILTLGTACNVQIDVPTQLDSSGASNSTPPPVEAVKINPDPAFRMTSSEIISSFSTSSCNAFNSESGYEIPISDDPGDPDTYRKGLVGALTTGPAGSRWTSLDRYAQSDAVRWSEVLYVNSLDVPERQWSRGFPLLDGEVVKDANGVPLLEYFRLDFAGKIQLQASDEEGEYEFAILSDDGASLKIAGQQIAKHSSVTPTKLMCGTQTVNMVRGQALPIELAYFQGPRNHIALQLMWRKKVAGAAPDAACGQAGPNYWWNSNVVPSVNRAPRDALASRGWKTIDPENFRIPDGVPFNPCKSPTVQSTFGNE